MQFLILAVAVATSTPTMRPKDAISDAAFYSLAAQSNLTEMSMGKLAQQKASSGVVKELASTLIADHDAANQKLSQAASKRQISLPKKSTLRQRATSSHLESLSGGEFDQSYVRDVIKDHEENIKVFNREATAGSDPDAKAYAAEMLPTLQSHLEKIRALAGTAGVQSR
jgi:putative membrane protein